MDPTRIWAVGFPTFSSLLFFLGGEGVILPILLNESNWKPRSNGFSQNPLMPKLERRQKKMNLKKIVERDHLGVLN